MLTKPFRMLAAGAVGLLLPLTAGVPAFAQDKPAEPAAEEKPKSDAPAQAAPATAAEAAATANERVFNLDNPSGVAVHPKTGHVFVSSSVAIYRYLPDEADRSKKINIEIVTDPPKIDEYGKGPVYKISPLGLGFLEDGRRRDKQKCPAGAECERR